MNMYYDKNNIRLVVQYDFNNKYRHNFISTGPTWMCSPCSPYYPF